MADLKPIADALIAAYDTATTLPPITASAPEFSVTDGYAVLHDIETRLALGNARQAESLEALLAAADVVTLHVPELPSTANMIGAEQLAHMKPGAHLINASRGLMGPSRA